jgi:basic membrane protein A
MPPTFARLADLLIGAAVACLVLSGCGPKKPPPPIVHIGFVAGPSGFGDHADNDAARAALVQCNRETNVSIETAVPASNADAEPKLVLFATEKFDTIIAIGYPVAPAVQTVARRFEDAHFALIDAVAVQPNIESLTFAEQDGAFLAGALAALVSKTHRIAFIGGADVPLLQRSEAGFIAGAREVDPRVRVTTRYLSSFQDAAPAQALAGGLLAQGSDIVFVIAGPAGRGVFAAVRAHPHAYAIGADADQSALAPGQVLASVVKRIDSAVLRVCRETVAGKSESGRRVLGLADDGIDVVDLAASGAVDRAARDRIGRIRAAIVAGRITPPAGRAALAHFVPVPVP